MHYLVKSFTEIEVYCVYVVIIIKPMTDIVLRKNKTSYNRTPGWKAVLLIVQQVMALKEFHHRLVDYSLHTFACNAS